MRKTDDVKEELGQYLQDKKLLQEKELDLEELITRATKVTTEMSDIPKGSPKVEDRMAELTAQIVDLKNQKYDQIIKMYKTKKEIEDKIDLLKQPYKNILYYKYIKGEKLEKISLEIGYNYKWLRA